MYRKLISRDRQELRAADLTDMQNYSSEGLQVLFADGIGTGQYYAGLDVTQTGPTEIRIAPGRYWNNGNVYARLENTQLGVQAELMNLLEFLPTQYEKAIALVTFARELSTDVEPRDFLISLDTLETEPQAVPMHLLKIAAVDAIEGIESPTPQIPLIPGGVLHFCTVYLGPTGILRIEMVESTRVPSTSGIYVSLEEFLRWKAQIEAQIESLRAMLAALLEAIKGFSPLRYLRQLGLDVARLKERANLPDTYSAYGSDWFVSEDETDTLRAGYSARIDNGLLFPIEASAQFNLALLAPNDASVINSNSKVLPAFTSVRKFGTTGYTGQDMALATEQQTFTLKTLQISSWQNAYGMSYNQYGAWWSQHYNQNRPWTEGLGTQWPSQTDKLNYAYNWTLQWNKNWTLAPVEYQYLSPTTTSIVGAMVAQTFLSPASMWLTRIGLNFTKIDTVGDVTIVVCNVGKTGEPMMGEVQATVTVPRANLKLYSTETIIDLPPTFLWAGRRYAICIVTQGTHRLAVVSGKQYTEGTLFTSTNGQFFEGDLAKDLLFNLYSAKFNSPRTVVSLSPASLAGGISDLYIKAPAFIPEGCQLQYEIQVGGVWHPLSEPTYHLATLPDTLPLRAVFVGTTDVQPCLVLSTNTIEVSRPKTSLTHWATLRTLTGNSTSITVKVLSYGCNPANHTLVAQLVSADGVTTYNAGVTTIIDEPDGSKWHNFEFTITAPGISSYRIKITASRTNATVEPFVILERLDIAV